MKSRIFFDLHTHTTYSHGKGSIADNAARAAELGLERLGISDHGPGSVSYGIDMKKIPQMRKDIEEAEKLFPQLKIELGVEANIANLSGRLDISREEQKLFDYIIAGYHYSYLGEKPFTGISICVGGWLHERGLTTSARTRVRNTDIVVNSLLENKIDIISHPGDKADFDIDAIAAACEKTGTVMEINHRHHCLTVEGIRIAAKYDVRFIMSSDAHTSDAVGCVENSWKRVLEAGLEPGRIINFREI